MRASRESGWGSGSASAAVETPASKLATPNARPNRAKPKPLAIVSPLWRRAARPLVRLVVQSDYITPFRHVAQLHGERQSSGTGPRERGRAATSAGSPRAGRPAPVGATRPA